MVDTHQSAGQFLVFPFLCPIDGEAVSRIRIDWEHDE
jgi:hypothetical protein